MSDQPLAFLFPGQGSQHEGMGTDLLYGSARSQHLVEQAERLTGVPVGQLIAKGSSEQLAGTRTAQVAVFTVSTALAAVLADEGIQPSAVAGHSLGEFSALTASGVLAWDDALLAVDQRSRAMAGAPASSGTMAAVLGLGSERAALLCERVPGRIVVATDNSHNQCVVSGEQPAVDAVRRLAKEEGAVTVVPLDVSGAFHSPLMAEAERRFRPTLQDLPLEAPGQVALVSSVTGAEVADPGLYRAALAGQITGPVRWRSVIESLLQRGIERFVEVGPGRVLTGLMRGALADMETLNVRSVADCRSLAADRAGWASRGPRR